VKTWLVIFTIALAPAGAVADVAKPAPAPRKLDHEARVYVTDKEAPSLDKTVRLAPPLPTALKNK
jgi:hypothetical protein